MRSPLIVAASMVSLASPALAQDQDAQLWLKLGSSIELLDDVELKLETNQRVSNEQGGLYESQYLVALSIDVGGGVELTGGVNRVVDVSDGRVSATEWRPRQQIEFPVVKIGAGELAGRLRLEQRFRTDGDDVGHRARPEVSYTLPLGGGLELKVAHESYLNLNTTDFGQVAGHERMRNSAALTVSISGSVDVEVGYLNQYRFNGEDPDLMEHALTTGLSVSF